MNELILYTTEDGRSQIRLRADRQTVWLTQREMADLFNVSADNIGLHLKNIYEDGELVREATAEESSVVQTEGGREVRRPVTRQTAAELILARANPSDAHFGLLHWQGAKVRKQDILIAKNYLTEDEIDTLNRLVVIFLETAELRTKRRETIPMAFWRQNVDQIINANGFPVLAHAGTVSHDQMERTTSERYLDYDRRRKSEEAREADAGDEAELKALEDSVKKRQKP